MLSQDLSPLNIYRYFHFQHANEDVEKMILGNKCDMTDKRVVNKERGEAVSIFKTREPFTRLEIRDH